jgi:hypothetical protein
MGTPLVSPIVVAYLLPTAVEYSCTTATVVAARTAGGCPRTVEVGAAVPRVAYKPCGTSVEHC